MKSHKLILIIALGILISCIDTKEKQVSDTSERNTEIGQSRESMSDTFSFENHFAEEPLLLEKETLETVKGLLGDTSLIEVDGPKKIPDFDEELIGFSKNKSSITAFNNPVRTGMIVYSADIEDKLPIFRNNVIVGMSKEELIKTFKLPKESSSANVFEVYYGEATSYVYLIFESQRLKKVLFWPYTG